MHLLGDFIIIQVKNAFIAFHKQQNSSVSYSITLFCSEISQTDNTVYAGCVVQANT